MADKARVIRMSSEGEFGSAIAKAISDGVLTTDAEREYNKALNEINRLESECWKKDREINYLQNNLDIQSASNKRFRTMFTNALTNETGCVEPTKADRIMSALFAIFTGAITSMAISLIFLIVKYCL